MMKELSKIAPVRVGPQGEGKHLVFTGENRRQRRAEKAVKAKPLPKSIWLITGVIEGVDVGQPIRTFRLTIERGGRSDTIVVHTKEGAAPQMNGLLERMTRPTGGEAFIWTNSVAEKSSMGGGYTAEAMPAEWTKRSFENLSPGVAWPGTEKVNAS